MKSINALTILLIFTIILSVVTGCTENPLNEIEIPVHPKAISPKHLKDKPVEGGKGVVYYVDSVFPADEIATYYETELSKMGYAPIESNRTEITREWVVLNPETLNIEQAKKPPAYYLAEWSDHNKETYVWLHIGYRYDGMDESWERKPLVNCNIVKYSIYLKGQEEAKKRLTN